jgi:hypothetical protein
MRDGRREDDMVLLKRTWSGSLPLLLGLALTACVDSDDRCGNERVLDATGVCVCKPGTVDQQGVCVEAPPVEGGLGDPCDQETPCTDPAFPDCHILSDDSGYCTKNDCSSSDECGNGYHCALDETPPYCHAPFTGQGVVCASDDDCADFEATFCSVGSPTGAVCLVRDCVDNTSCSPGYVCVDLGMFMPGLPKACLPPM